MRLVTMDEDRSPRPPRAGGWRRWFEPGAPLRRLLHGIGLAITVAAFVYIGYEVWFRSSQLTEFTEPSFLLRLGVAAIAAGLSTILLVAGWQLALRATSEKQLSARDAFSIFGRSNILKYLPTNVLHFAGRYALLLDRGFANRAIIASTAAEHALLIAAALLLAIVFGAPTLIESLAGLAGDRSRLVVLATGAVVMLVAAAGAVFVVGGRERSTVASAGLLAPAVIVYLLYFLSLGGIAAMIAWAAHGALGLADYLSLTGIVSAAFIVGLVTPGAPAGFGVREAVIVLGLNGAEFAGSAMVIALGLRIATLGGDMLLGLAGLLLTPTRTDSAVEDRRAAG